MSKKTTDEPIDPRLTSYALGHRIKVLSASDGAELKRLLTLAGVKVLSKSMADPEQSYGEILRVGAFEVVKAK